MRSQLEAVDFELFWFCDLHFGQELADVVPLVALQLDHFTVLRVLHNCSITRELLNRSTEMTSGQRSKSDRKTYLLACLHDLLLVVIVWNALNCGQCLPAVPLLDTDVNQAVLNTTVIGIDGIGERVWRRATSVKSIAIDITITHRMFWGFEFLPKTYSTDFVGRWLSRTDSAFTSI